MNSIFVAAALLIACHFAKRPVSLGAAWGGTSLLALGSLLPIIATVSNHSDAENLILVGGIAAILGSLIIFGGVVKALAARPRTASAKPKA